MRSLKQRFPSMSMRILKSGILDSVQDAGRFGFARWGINRSGVMDTVALRIGNALVGNPPGEAALEMHFPAPRLQFTSETLISITGGDFDADLDGMPLPSWKPALVKEGSVLTFRKKRLRSRCYLSVKGGFAISEWLGSKSTNKKAIAGGYNGRAMQSGDVLPLSILSAAEKTKSPENVVLPWSVNAESLYTLSKGMIFFLEGSEWKRLSKSDQHRIQTQPFIIDPQSDRMATYLSHERIYLERNEELLSSAVTFGTMQLLPDGQLIVLMADHQTTGGYPVIGNVITAHLHTLAQHSPGESVRFQRIELHEAVDLLRSLEETLRKVEEACSINLETYYARNRS